MADPNPAVTFCAALVDEWVRCGLRHAVVSPGSRSTPLALALVRRPEVHTEVVLDERSASFMALGVGLATGVPAVLVCTSGTAAAEFHPAVVEAHQADVPLLVCTADRPPELQGVGAPQTIDQRDLYGRSVRWYCEPGPPAPGGAPWWRSLARDAWVRTSGARPGPVHLNLAFREPLVGPLGELPPVDAEVPPSPVRPSVPDEVLARLVGAVRGRRGVIVAGVRTAADRDEATAVHALAAALGWPVLADAPSGCRIPAPATVTTFDAVLRHPEAAEALLPEVVFRFGGLLASKVTGTWLAGSGALQVGVDRHGDIPDPDHVVAERLPVAPAHLVERLLPLLGGASAPAGWGEAWAAVERRARVAIDGVLADSASEPTVAAAVLAALPEGGHLVVSSSMPVRDLEWYAPARDGVRVLANRGANGIDGVTSTALGVAMGGAPTALLIGDLAFLHDAGALLGAADRPVDLTIVVSDNDGGGIFSFLPQAGELESAEFERLFGTPHGTDLVAVARAYGVVADRVPPDALGPALAEAIGRPGVRVVVVPSERAANVALHRRINTAVAEAVG